MKKEIISFVIGAGIVGAFWTGTAFCKNESKNTTPVSEQKINEKQSNLLKKTLTDIYSATPNKSFPGLELTDTDFLVPFNRLQITEHFYFTSPNEFLGSGGSKGWSLVFRIQEKGKHHYFIASGKQYGDPDKLVYLGENIVIENVTRDGGCIDVKYKDGKGRQGYGWAAAGFIADSQAPDSGIAKVIPLDPLLKSAEHCDPFVWKMTAEELWKLLQKSLRKNDKMTIAKMITFPMDFKGERIYTRAEFIKKFDEIFYPEYKEFVLKSDASEIWYSWRGAGLPDNCSWCTNADKGGSAGPLALYPERWLNNRVSGE